VRSPRTLTAALPFVLALACAPELGDVAGRPQDARPLQLGVAARDSLKCDVGDCADWYALVLDAKRPVELQLDADTGPAWNVAVELILRDAAGNELGHERSDGRPTVSLRAELAPGRYWIAVRSATAGSVVPYSLVARGG